MWKKSCLEEEKKEDEEEEEEKEKVLSPPPPTKKRRRVRTKSKEEKLAKCPHCLREFTNLKHHINQQHAQVRSFNASTSLIS